MTAPEADQPVTLVAPRDGVPDPIRSEADLAAAARRLAAGHGPLAVDTERASGFRYYPRAYLVQVRREGAGTFLFDPVEVPDLSPVRLAVPDSEWVLHAASQDLPALHGVGMRPPAVFDTELAARLAGLERVGLGALTESLLGVRLEKGHGAADWSVRPLPHEWLVYAALDVELLVELRDVLAELLRAAGKEDWAYEEFEAVLAASDEPPAPRSDPWRRTSGINTVRGGRSLAVVRALWLSRDALARETDRAPGRVLPDRAIVAAATAMPDGPDSLARIPPFGGRNQRQRLSRWWAAVAEAYALGDADLPRATGPGTGPPSATGRWARRDPVAAERLARARAAVLAVAEPLAVPVENLVPPDLVRRLAWEPPAETTEPVVAEILRAGGARRWQVALTAAPLAAALSATPTTNGVTEQ